MSSSALAQLRQPAYSDQRRRAGWFLFDSQRQPCGEEPWLWLAEVYGGGSGNNLALVYSKNKLPKTPIADAFRFRALSDNWWLAYQNPGRYYLHLHDAKGCVDGISVGTHWQGMQFVVTPTTN